MPDVRIHPHAQKELDAAIAWYEDECEHLGIEFFDEVDRAIDRIIQNPDT